MKVLGLSFAARTETVTSLLRKRSSVQKKPEPKSPS